MLNDILGQINDLMYTYLLLFLLLGTGLYFSIRSRFAQVRLMKEGFRILTEKAEVEDGKRQVSSFQALMISTASRVGTGNIAGIATAIAAGGPGAVFWMHLSKVHWHRYIRQRMEKTSAAVLPTIWRRRLENVGWECFFRCF